jgi:uncharacterized protein
MNIVMYHSADNDGYCSAAIASHFYREHGVPFILKPYNYGDNIPWDEIDASTNVIMLDVSLQPYDLMRDMMAICANMTWIDHHRSALDILHDFQPCGIRRVGTAACELTWEHYYSARPVPRFIHLLSEYDVWHNADAEKWEKEILPLQYGFRLRCTDVMSPNSIWPMWMTMAMNDDQRAMDSMVAQYIADGELVIQYERQRNERYMRSYAYEQNWNGLRALICNSGLGSSQIFESHYRPEYHDLMIAYCDSGASYKVSLYSTKPDIDCSKIAVAHGGGGHKDAAGFECHTLPWKRIS